MSTKTLDDTMSSSQMSTSANDHCFKCVGQNKGIEMCLNDKCKQKNALGCYNEACKCQSLHMKCQKGNIRNVLNSVNSKIDDTKELVNEIQSTVKQLIDQLNQLKVDLLKQVEQKVKYIRWMEIQKKFMNVSKGLVKVQQMNSTQLKELWSLANVNYDKKKSNINPFLTEILSNQKSNIRNKMNDIKTSFRKTMADFQSYEKKTYIPMLTKQLTTTQIKLTEEISKVSQICKSSQMSQNLMQYFNKQVQKFEQVYCASKNEFSIQKFFENHGTKTDLLFLCKTNQDNIIGAYSPHHHFSDKDQWIPDNQGNSFIFSLSNNQKFQLKSFGNSIYRRKAKDFIKFGNDELNIRDKCNTSPNCRTDVNCNYYFKPTYGGMTQDSCYKKFNGNSCNKITLKQWQVYKVEFSK